LAFLLRVRRVRSAQRLGSRDTQRCRGWGRLQAALPLRLRAPLTSTEAGEEIIHSWFRDRRVAGVIFAGPRPREWELMQLARRAKLPRSQARPVGRVRNRRNARGRRL